MSFSLCHLRRYVSLYVVKCHRLFHMSLVIICRSSLCVVTCVTCVVICRCMSFVGVVICRYVVVFNVIMCRYLCRLQETQVT